MGKSKEKKEGVRIKGKFGMLESCVDHASKVMTNPL